jgi:hypothetical protein
MRGPVLVVTVGAPGDHGLQPPRQAQVHVQEAGGLRPPTAPSSVAALRTRMFVRLMASFFVGFVVFMTGPTCERRAGSRTA